MKKIYLEKQFMKAKNLDNYIIGEFVGSSQERGVHKIKQEDGNILYVLSHSLLGWEDYTEKHKKETKEEVANYKFQYTARETNEVADHRAIMFFCDVYKNGKFFYRYCYGFDWLGVLNRSDSFRYFLQNRGNKVECVFEKSWQEFKDIYKQKQEEPKFELWIEKGTRIYLTEEEDTETTLYYLKVKNNETNEERIITSNQNLYQVETTMYAMAESFKLSDKKVKVYVKTKEQESIK